MEKILVIQTAFIGDAILTLPMIEKLKETFPESSLDVIVIPSTREIFEASPFVNNVLVLDKKGADKKFTAFLKFCKKIKKNNYTRIYGPHRSMRTSIMVLLSGVRETYGFDKNSLNHVYRHLVEYRTKDHEVQRNLRLTGVNVTGDNWRIPPILNISDDGKLKVESFFLQSGINPGNKIAAVAPGSVWNTKKYPREYFEEVILHLLSENYFVLLIGGKKDGELCRQIETALAGRLEKNKEKIISTAGKFSLIESVEIIKRCKILICNDSAPTHLGMCSGIPVLTIYCSTIAGFGFYPYNSKSSYLSYDDLFCKPCGIHGFNECPVKTFDCGYKLIPGTVITKIKEMINAD